MVVASPAVVITFSVRGNPVTKGSMRPWHKWRADGRCLVTMSEEHGARLKEWRALAATQAKRAMRDLMPFGGPVRVEMTFTFERPKTHKTLERDIPWVAVRGRNDIEKLVRAMHDAMTDAAVWGDDAQVSVLSAEKRYCDGLERPGVVVTVEALT